MGPKLPYIHKFLVIFYTTAFVKELILYDIEQECLYIKLLNFLIPGADVLTPWWGQTWYIVFVSKTFK
jgi:hypothetical protein